MTAARGLEAKADELFGFFGPICRNFKLNEKHQDIGFIHEVLPVTVPVRYGIVDAERERRERMSRSSAKRLTGFGKKPRLPSVLCARTRRNSPS